MDLGTVTYNNHNITGLFTNSTQTGLGTEEEADNSALLAPGRVVPLAIVTGILVLATIGANLFVIVAVATEHSLRSITHMFIVSLAVSDLMVGLLVLPLSATYEILDVWVFGQELCVVWCAVDVLCCTASILNLVVISVDRYIAISRPMHYSSILTSPRACVVVLAVWSLSVLVSIPPLFGWRKERHDPNQCDLTSGVGYIIYSASGSFYIPMVIMLCVYYRIYVVAVRQTKAIKIATTLGSFTNPDMVDDNTPSDTDHHRIHDPHTLGSGQPISSPTSEDGALLEPGLHRRGKGSIHRKFRKFAKEKKAAKTLAIVIGAFILCWFPFFFVYTIRDKEICRPCNVPKWTFKLFFWLGYCNSALNPIVYTFLNRDFKRTFYKMWFRSGCIKRPKRPSLLYDFGLPRRSVRPIRASTRMRMSIGPGEAKSLFPESPQPGLFRKQISAPSDQQDKDHARENGRQCNHNKVTSRISPQDSAEGKQTLLDSGEGEQTLFDSGEGEQTLCGGNVGFPRESDRIEEEPESSSLSITDANAGNEGPQSEPGSPADPPLSGLRCSISEPNMVRMAGSRGTAICGRQTSAIVQAWCSSPLKGPWLGRSRRSAPDLADKHDPCPAPAREAVTYREACLTPPASPHPWDLQDSCSLHNSVDSETH